MGYGLGDDTPDDMPSPVIGFVAPATGEACEATRTIIGKTAGAAFTGLATGGSHSDTGSTEKRQEGPVEPRIRETLPRDTPATDLEVARVAIGACVGDLLLGRSPNTRRQIGVADAVGALRAVAEGLEHVVPVAAEPRDRLSWIQARIADLAAEYHAAYPGDDGSALRYALEGAADRDRRTREQARKAARQASQGK